MAFVTEGSQAFLSNTDDNDDDTNFAALDSMTSGMTNQSAFLSQQGSSSSGTTAMTAANASSGSNISEGGGEMGESLFDRIRRRTEEQQRQQQAAATTTQQPSAESNIISQGLEREPSDGIIPNAPPTTTASSNSTSSTNIFDAAVQSAANPNNTISENTYSFTATTGEDFSFQPTHQPPSIPTYGPSRNDPSYYSANNSQQFPQSFQERATMALNDAGSTMKSMLERGMSGAGRLVSMGQDRLGGRGVGGGYTNNFLLREDSMEQGMGSDDIPQPPPPTQTTTQMGQAEAVTSGQGYSMIAYAKTFCEDLYGFLMQLPPVGKVGVLVVLLALWLLMRG